MVIGIQYMWKLIWIKKKKKSWTNKPTNSVLDAAADCCRPNAATACSLWSVLSTAANPGRGNASSRQLSQKIVLLASDNRAPVNLKVEKKQNKKNTAPALRSSAHHQVMTRRPHTLVNMTSWI